MAQGKIVKGIAGFYYVKADGVIYECKARGKFRNQNLSPLIGDNVELSIEHRESMRGEYKTASIEKILSRKNEMIRPPVANVDQAIIVLAASFPEPNLDLLDKLLILVKEQGIDAVICVNKIDIDNSQVLKIQRVYEKIGYSVICTSAKDGIGVDELIEKLNNKTSFFAGNSGVGKSTLLNAVEPSLNLQTGSLSEKIQRGKHTTRHVELMSLKTGGYVLDTPGFSSISIEHIEADELKNYYIEFLEYESNCKFTSCSHVHEPNCSVKNAVEQNEIDFDRYQRYVAMYKQLKNIRRW